MSQATILIVDDSPTHLKVTTDCLSSYGYRLVTAMDGEEALEKAKEEKPNLIVLDVVLPGQSGFQICRTLKTQGETKGIPVIMLSSKDQESDRFWGLKQGADAYLTKPFLEEDLLTTIAQHIGHTP